MPIMFTCPHCGHTTEVADEYVGRSGPCFKCGNTVTVPGASNPFSGAPTGVPAPYPTDSIGDDAAMRLLFPVGRSIWAIISGYAGLIGLGCPPLGLVGVICGFVAISDIRKHPDRHGMGRAVFGIISGLIGTVVTVILVIAAIANA